MIIDEKFKKKREKQCLVIEEVINNDSSISNTFNKLVKEYSIITNKEVEESKKTGYIAIQDLEINEVVGALYVRKCTSLNRGSSYNIELLLNSVNSKTADSLVDAISTIYSLPFCCVKPDSIPDITIVVFGNSIIGNKQICKDIASEYGASGRVYLLQEKTVIELQDFDTIGEFSLQDLVTYVSQEDEESFDIEIPSSSQLLELKNKEFEK